MNPKGKEKILLEMSNTKRVTLEGIVKKYLPRKKGGIIVLNVKKILLPEREVDVKGNVRITIRYSKADFKKGDRVLMSPDLFLPKNFNNPGRFDYVRYLAQKGIHITGVINSSRDILILEKGCLSPPILLIEEIREKIKEALIHSFGNSPSEALIETLLLGEKKRLSQNYIDIFNRAGVAHILAISGLHMGMIAFFFYFLFKLIQKISLRWMLYVDIRKVAAILTFIPVILYLFISGARISALRAAIMIFTFLFAIIFNRDREPLDALAVAAFFILIFSPSSIFTVSFQLSFICVFFILYLVPKWTFLLKAEELRSGFLKIGIKKLIFFLFTSASAIIGASPLTIFYFHRFSPIALVSNIFIIPLVGLAVLPFILIGSFFLFIYFKIGILFFKLAIFFSYVVINLAKIFASLPFGSFFVYPFHLPELFLVYLLIFLIIHIRKDKKWFAIFSITLSFFIILYSWPWIRPLFFKDLTITFLDVGAGDAILIEFPKGKKMVIDAGGTIHKRWDIGEKVVVPFLWYKKIKDIDFLVLSSFGYEHAGGLPAIFKSFKVKEFWFPNSYGLKGLDPFLFNKLLVSNSKIIPMDMKSPDVLIDNVKVSFLWPPHDIKNLPFKFSSNDDSLVIKLKYKDNTFLFTGDITKRTEKILIKNGDALKVDLLKVPNHGSLYSSSDIFLDKVEPKIGVITGGTVRLVRYSHPRLFRRYKKRGIKLISTQREGAIIVRSNGYTLKIRSFKDKKIN